MLGKIESWYNNIGGKIRYFAIGSFIVEAIASIILGLTVLINGNGMGLLIMLAGPFAAFGASWTLYGFGELIEKVTEILYNMQKKEREIKEQNQITDNYWRCQKCDKKMPPVLTTCNSCGAPKP